MCNAGDRDDAVIYRT